MCSACGTVTPTWMGKCGACGEWNTIIEQLSVTSNDVRAGVGGKKLVPRTITEVNEAKQPPRISVGVGEADLVLGGGIVAGSVLLLAGQPGIGKSTILMQMLGHVAKSQKVLYISGEESIEQVALRARRLDALSPQLLLVSSNSTNDIATTISSTDCDLVVVDSIQTLACNEIASAPGSPSQITNSTHMLTAAAKGSNTALLIVGHVTKEGSIAGPKLLEHMVDVVLNLEGDRYGGFKVLRAIKNRYGSTEEAAIFEMNEYGLQAVQNPSAALLSERQMSDGSIVLATVEGTRPLLVEVQALVNTSSYGYPKRTASGFDLNRLNLLIAVLEKRTKLQLADKDIFINIVGGIKIQDPAADLAVCMAIGSAAKGLKPSEDAVVFGEVGLAGEVRHVRFADKRIGEAVKLGFSKVVGPKIAKPTSEYHAVSDLRTALNTYLGKGA